MRFVGLLLMIGAAGFAWLYDTGRWPSFWAVLSHGPNAVRYATTGTAVGIFPTGQGEQISLADELTQTLQNIVTQQLGNVLQGSLGGGSSGSTTDSGSTGFGFPSTPPIA